MKMSGDDPTRLDAKAVEREYAWAEEDLDAALRAWSAKHAPSAGQLAAIRLATLDQAACEGDVLSYEWWERLFAGMRETVWRSLGAQGPLPEQSEG